MDAQGMEQLRADIAAAAAAQVLPCAAGFSRAEQRPCNGSAAVAFNSSVSEFGRVSRVFPAVVAAQLLSLAISGFVWIC